MKRINLTVLRFKYLCPTDTEGARFSIVQTNNCKRMIISYNYEVSDTAEHVLDLLGVNYSQVIDNTAKKSIDYVIYPQDPKWPITNYIELIKAYKKTGELS